MKHVLTFALLLLALPAFAQIPVEHRGARFFDLTYTAGGSDTSGSQSYAGARALSFVLTTADSAALDVYVQYKLHNTTWTTVMTDSLVTVTNTGATREFSIKDGDSDLLSGVTGGVRVIIAARATGNGVSSPTFTASWYFRP